MTPDISYIKRDLETLLKKYLHQGKVLVLYGARQVGKTTLIKNLFTKSNEILYLACDQSRIREQLIPDTLALNRLAGNYQTLILDEAQYLDNPGLVLKILIDSFPQKTVIASGSSSFDLANKLSEPLTGRHFKFLLFPLTISEVAKHVPRTDLQFHLEETLIFGNYPEIFKSVNHEEKIRQLTTLTDAYLYKDILAFNLVKSNQKIKELLVAIALQIGSEVSYSELANTIGMDRKTIESYLDLLEKSFVLFRLYGFSRNLRSEINRKVKIYFYDVGVRNALINNFNAMTLRNDTGPLFENFIIAEMVKRDANQAQKPNLYFWRTYEQKEVDLVSEKNGIITAYEIKFKKPKSSKGLIAFQAAYPKSQIDIISLDKIAKGKLDDETDP